MHMLSLFFAAIFQVLLVGILVGAGLPALFSVGIKALAWGAGGDAEVSHEAGNPAGTVLAYLCFALVIVFIGLGIAIVVASGLGYHVDFAHVIPTFTKK